MSKLTKLIGRRSAGNRYCYLYLHIAKCAGSSIVARFASLGSQGIHLSEKCQTKDEARRIFQRKMAVAQQATSPSQLRVIYGHRVFAGLSAEVPRPTRLVFFLRDPVSMVVSLYNYCATIALDQGHPYHGRERDRMLNGQGQLIHFRDWLDTLAPQNLTICFLYHAVAGDLAPGTSSGSFTSEHLEVCKSAVNDAHFVGFVETIERDGPALLQMVGAGDAHVNPENVSKKTFRLSDDPTVRRVMEERNSLDCDLYRFALQQRGRRTHAA
ncbi:MAG: sulfotransferase family 2 domain-containing protein [Pirellulales bacterium]|nr:sulfotransferase family 2 domain-containing protein [Pirellulales bacterium]